MTEHFVIAETCYNQKIIVDANDVIGKAILQKGIYDKTGLYFIEKILTKFKPSVIFDIGASIGNHALRMSQYCDTIYLFEPQAVLTSCLTKTANLNHLLNWKIFHTGLSDENKSLVLYKNLDSNIESSFVPELKGKNFLPEQTSVCIGDEIVQQHSIPRVDFMKIDVEGFEAKVILGLKNTIHQFRPLIFMEWDKRVTKDQFHAHNLFERIFTNYYIKSIVRNPAESHLYKKIIGKIHRFFSPHIKRKRWIIGDFYTPNSYRHIILVPIEKAYLLEGL